MARASFQELRQFLPRRKAEAVVVALSMSAIAETEHALSDQLDNPESIYRACADMKLKWRSRIPLERILQLVGQLELRNSPVFPLRPKVNWALCMGQSRMTPQFF